jgi:hypothetical protein
MPQDREHEAVFAPDVKSGMQKNFERVVIEVVEVNPLPSPPPPLVVPKRISVAYRIRDTRQNPPFVSGVAHLHLTANEDAMKWFRKIVKDYNDRLEKFGAR